PHGRLLGRGRGAQVQRVGSRVGGPGTAERLLIGQAGGGDGVQAGEHLTRRLAPGGPEAAQFGGGAQGALDDRGVHLVPAKLVERDVHPFQGGGGAGAAQRRLGGDGRAGAAQDAVAVETVDRLPGGLDRLGHAGEPRDDGQWVTHGYRPYRRVGGHSPGPLR